LAIRVDLLHRLANDLEAFLDELLQLLLLLLDLVSMF
jgi:hypothetical protein